MRHGRKQQRKARILLRAAFVVLLAASQPVRAGAQDAVADKAASIKAAYLLNFVKYTQWPAESFQTTDSSIVISVVGHCGVAEILKETAPQSDTVTGRRIEIDVPAVPAEAADGQQADWISFYDHLKTS